MEKNLKVPKGVNYWDYLEFMKYVHSHKQTAWRFEDFIRETLIIRRRENSKKYDNA